MNKYIYTDRRFLWRHNIIYLGITGLNVRTPRYKNVSENRSDYKSNRAPRRECFLLLLLRICFSYAYAQRSRQYPFTADDICFFLFVFILLFMHAVAYLFRSCLPIYFSSSDDTLYCYIRPPAAAAAGEVVADDANPVRLYEKII